MPNNDPTTADNAAMAHAAAAAKTKRIEQVVINVDLHVKIYRKPSSPNWFVQYNVGGKQVRKSLRTINKNRALRRAHEIALDLEASTIWSRSGRAMSIEQAVDQYLAYMRTRNRPPKMQRLYRRCFEQFMHWHRSQGVTATTQPAAGRPMTNHSTYGRTERAERLSPATCFGGNHA